MKTVMNFSVPQKSRNFLTNWATVDFTRRVMHCPLLISLAVLVELIV